jgi:hypothetical protein
MKPRLQVHLNSLCVLVAACPAALVLLLAKLCMFMEDSSVPYVMEVLAAGFQGRTGFRASDEPPPFVGGEVARRLGTAASKLSSRCMAAKKALAEC